MQQSYLPLVSSYIANPIQHDMLKGTGWAVELLLCSGGKVFDQCMYPRSCFVQLHFGEAIVTFIALAILYTLFCSSYFSSSGH